MIAPVLEIVLGSGGALSTIVAAIRALISSKESRSIIKIEAGNKEWTIDTSGMTPDSVIGLLKALSGEIESQTPAIEARPSKSPDPPRTC